MHHNTLTLVTCYISGANQCFMVFFQLPCQISEFKEVLFFFVNIYLVVLMEQCSCSFFTTFVFLRQHLKQIALAMVSLTNAFSAWSRVSPSNALTTVTLAVNYHVSASLTTILSFFWLVSQQ
jgi:hypothetical protein